MGRQQRFTVDLYLPCPAKGQGRLLAVCLNHPRTVNKLCYITARQASRLWALRLLGQPPSLAQ